MTHSTLHSRRTLLKAAAVTAVAGFPLGSCAAKEADVAPATRPSSDPWRGLKVGVASYSFRKLPLDACIKAIQRVDLHYVSIKDVHLSMTSTADERKAVSQKFRDAGITPLSCGNITLKNDEAKCRLAFEYVRDIGAPTMVCIPDPEALPMLDKLVKEYDIKLAIHNHGPETPHFKSPADVWPAIQALDPRIGLCIDVGHTARAGTDPAEAMRSYKARLYDCHFKDVGDIHGKNGKSEVEVGRGVLDIPAMLRALLEINYAGHVGFEHEKTPEEPIPGIAESVGYTKGVLRIL
jgi:sugar phosphate isomerase/epimerase